MASQLFGSILSHAAKGSFPRTRKWVWKTVYNTMSRFWRSDDWRFMNYGYIAPDTEPFSLEAVDEKDRAFIGLYHQAVSGIDLTGKRVLEIGSGRGGGTSYIARYHNPEQIIGLDYSITTVRVAEKLNRNISNLSFQQGDAEDLPFEDASFDVVVNIESSHCYANVDAFVNEAARVLKPNGVFTWADLGSTDMINKIEGSFEGAPLELIAENRLSAGVVAALDQMSEKKEEQIKKHKLFGRFMNEFAATKGTTLYKGIKAGKVPYLSRRYRKTD